MGWGIGSEKNSERLTGQALDSRTLPMPETQKRPTDSARLVICNSKLYCPVLRTAFFLVFTRNQNKQIVKAQAGAGAGCKESNKIQCVLTPNIIPWDCGIGQS